MLGCLDALPGRLLLFAIVVVCISATATVAVITPPPAPARMSVFPPRRVTPSPVRSPLFVIRGPVPDSALARFGVGG
jgi:hypothetical protein